jgi:7,8-dihydropterin-6-yl-methyl-4-(beta-D-ribofuranosyl)aminobenzene 5'-phosphate synthase
MSREVIITALVENCVNLPELGAEHGFSLLIKSDGRKLLFDTGQTQLITANATKLGLVLDDLDSVVLSHGHYDHTGGLATIMQAAPRARIYAHPSFVGPKFTLDQDGRSRFIGLAPGTVELLRRSESRITWTTKPTEVLPGIFVTGEIPRTNLFETTGGRFFLDAGCACPDPLLDDQALYFDTPSGLVIVLGCAHSGVVNTMAHIRDLQPSRPFHAIIGGMHLKSASPDRMRATIEAFRRWAPRQIFPGHCTGTSAFCQLSNAFPGACEPCPVGTSLSFLR